MNVPNKNVKKQKECAGCKFGTPDMKEENLSIEGKPTLIICSFKPWPKHIISEPACKKFQPC